MKTIVITFKTDQSIHKSIALPYTKSNCSHDANDSTAAEYQTSDGASPRYADDQTLFGSSAKDDFMYRLAISG